MVAALIDTSVVVDILRGFDPALEWLDKQDDLAVCRAVWLEIIEGVQNKTSQRKALQLLRRFDLVEVTEEDVRWAAQWLLHYNLSHNIDAFDCMIAAVSHRLDKPLYTRNIKHFKPLLNNKAIVPY